MVKQKRKTHTDRQFTTPRGEDGSNVDMHQPDTQLPIVLGVLVARDVKFGVRHHQLTPQLQHPGVVEPQSGRRAAPQPGNAHSHTVFSVSS